MICQACHVAKATCHVTERLPLGGYQEFHFCEACCRSKMANRPPGIGTGEQRSAEPGIRSNRQRAVFCGRCKREVTGRELSCPHCGQSFADCIKCHACHSAFLKPLDPILWSRILKTGTGYRDAVLQGFVCEECGYRWNPHLAT
jgi:protein-arginine kinase activator protein McsA